MIFGNPCREKIQLNENTVWAGQPHRNDNPDARESLPKARQLIFEGKYKEAQDLVNRKFISKVSNGMPYQTVGNLNLLFPGHENFTNYYRELDIEKAVATTRYIVGGITFTHEAFASTPDQVIIIRITANKPGKINFTALMDRPSQIDISTNGSNKLILSGTTGDCDSIMGRVKFQAQVKIVTEDGTITATDSSLIIANSNTATIYISIASSFNNYSDISANAGEIASRYLQAALRRDYIQVLNDNNLRQKISFIYDIRTTPGETYFIINK